MNGSPKNPGWMRNVLFTLLRYFQWGSYPLRVKFALLLIGLTLVGGGSLGTIAVVSTYELSHNARKQEYLGRARALASHIQEILSGASRDLSLLARLDSLPKLLTARLSGREREQTYGELLRFIDSTFYAILLSHPAYQEVRLFDKDGWELLGTDLHRGKVKPASDKLLENVRGENFFQSALRGEPGQVYVSPTALYEKGKQGNGERSFTMVFATTVLGKEGGTIGVIALNVDPFVIVKESTEPVLLEIEAERGEIIVTDTFRHYFFAQKQGDSIWFNTILPDPVYSPIFSSGFNARVTILEHLAGGKRVNHLRLKDKYLFFSAVKPAPELNDAWVVIIQIPNFAVTAPAMKTAGRLGLVVLLLLVVGVITAHLASLHSVRAISEITESAKRIAAGDLYARAKAIGKDEIAILAEQFNLAMDKRLEAEKELKMHRDRLDELVRERSKRLAESEERYRTLFNQAPSGIVLVSEGQIVMVNEELARMVGGSSPERLEGMPIARFIHTEDAEAVSLFITAILTSEEALSQAAPKSLECRLIRMDGSEAHVILTGARIIYEGKPSALLLAKDVTEMKLLTEQLARTQRLEALGTLAAGMAHDFNNMLTGIAGYAHLLQSQVKACGEIAEQVNRILQLVERGKALTDRILTFTGKRKIKKVTVSMNEFLEEFAGLVRRLLPETIRVSLSLPTKEFFCSFDPGLIEQALMNLCVNARDAMQGKGTLELKLEALSLSEEYFAPHPWFREIEKADKAGDYLVISVSDTGVGMSEETQRHIFEPFYTTKPPGEGTGLGLAMVQGIAKQHDGFVHCYSELGKGTTFKIYLPYKEDKQAIAEAVAFTDLQGEGTILLAEDEDFLRDVIKTFLTRFGYHVIPCKDGEMAVQEFTARKDEIRAVVLDMVMPKMGGTDALEKIRALQPNIKAILTTGYTKEQLSEEELGDNILILEKPFAPRELAIALKKLLSEKATIPSQ